MTDVLEELRHTLETAEEKGARRLAGILRRAIAQIERLRRGRSAGGRARWAGISVDERRELSRRMSEARYGKSGPS